MAAVKVLAGATATNPHPYLPLDAIIPGYEANTRGVLELLGAFSGVSLVLFISTYVLARSIQPNLTRGELAKTIWFVLSGSIHIVFEGYYALNFRTLGAKQTIIGQMWKEYAYSDSRYLTSNSFVLCVESITTVVWGPGCLLVAWLIIKRHPLRYSLQALVSLGESYGDVIYYATVAFDHAVLGVTHSRPEAFYFWFYFVAMNAIWIVVPGFLIVQSCLVHARAIAALELDHAKKSR